MKLQNKSDKRKKLIVIVAATLAVLALIIGVICLILFGGGNTVINNTGIDNIILSSTPIKTSYYVGETFEPDGAKIQVLMHNDNDYHFVEHTELTFSGFDSSTAGEKTITVSYRGFTTSFLITVSERPSDNPVITDIEICDFQNSYALDFWNEYGPQIAGASVKLIYSDGSTQEGIWIQSNWISGYERLDAPGTIDLTIKYDTGAGIIEKVVTVTITK